MTSRRLMLLALTLLISAYALAANIPAGTRLTVRITDQLSSGRAHVGQSFDGVLVRNAVVNGKTVAKAGTPVRGKVTHVKPSGRLHHPGEITVRLTSIALKEGHVPLSTTAFRRIGKSHTKSNVTKIGGGAAAGTVIGALAGGGKGAAIGAGVGAAAGTGAAAATGKTEAVIPAESTAVFTVTSSSSARRR